MSDKLLDPGGCPSVLTMSLCDPLLLPLFPALILVSICLTLVLLPLAVWDGPSSASIPISCCPTGDTGQQD